MKEMTKHEVQNFLMAGTLTGKVATSRKDGVAHVVPVWFILDNDANIIFATGKQSAKGKHLLRDPRVVFSVDGYRQKLEKFTTRLLILRIKCTL
jgi:nitroimidazol reductase NimA-like FMN-containing flavoprotein (pyridoxamine 5'-phosphate oxidase superfamily)